MSDVERIRSGLVVALADAWAIDPSSVAVDDLRILTAGARRRNAVFTATLDGRPQRLVVTIAPPAEVNAPIATEVAVRRTARAAGVAVPEVIAHGDNGSPLGEPFMVSAFVAGETVPRRVLRLIDERGHGAEVARQLGATVARFHGVDAWGEIQLEPVPPGPPAEAAVARLTGLLASLRRPRPALELGLRWLARSLPPPPERTVVLHGDIRNGNIIVDGDGLAAVLDWENVRPDGDPMADLAWGAQRMWRFGNDDREIGGFAHRTDLAAGYEAAGGTFDQERFDWWKVESTLRWALGLAAQAHAFVDGRMTDIVMAGSGRRVTELEWDVLSLIRPDAVPG